MKQTIEIPERIRKAYNDGSYSLEPILQKYHPEIVQELQGVTTKSNWLIKDRLIVSQNPSYYKSKESATKNVKALLDAGVTDFICFHKHLRKERSNYYPIAKKLLGIDSSAAQKLSITYFPIGDFNVEPDENVDKFTDTVVDMLKYNQDRVIFMHCREGNGRSGTIAAIVYGKYYRKTPEEALIYTQMAHDCRKKPRSHSPETEPQKDQVVRILNKYLKKK